MELMRLVLPILILPAIFAANADLVRVKSVYMLPMSNGMDQYLANHLLAADLYVVVTDPKAADAVFTDSLGPAFERKMTELYPPEKPAEKEKDKDEDADKGAIRESGAPANPISTFRRGRGMVFLVDRTTRKVVWSVYEPPKNASSDSLDRAARKITGRLKKELEAKAPAK
ncbi:MAG: hypothetical protein IT166_25105 [Bryobacterales bacterium]|nr:hypothetical protein [Bryobacterales bacterium]